MLRRGVLVLCALVAVVGGVFVVARAATGTGSEWQNADAPTVQKVIDLPPNVLPSTSNSNCVPTSVRHYAGNAAYEECLTTTAAGQASIGGIIYEGTSVMLPVVPPAPFQSVQPIPRQGLFYTTTSAPVLGSYMHFYRSIYDKFGGAPIMVNGAMSYKLNASPDFALRDANGALLAVNLNTLTFSKNGNWMVVDVVGKGLVRINLATFDMLAFAPSLQLPNDNSNLSAQISISSDGQNVVMKPSNANSLKVFHLENCTNATIPVTPNTVTCPVRDYWTDISSFITTLKGLYQPRFVNDTQVSFNVTYDVVPGNFKVATHTLTAPGVSPAGIEYLGMGDSFASGEGAFSYYDGTDTSDNNCHLSTKSYGFIISFQLFNSGHAVSCSGAKMEDISGEEDTYAGQTIIKVQKQKRSHDVVDISMINYIPGYLVQSEFVDTYKPEALTLSIGGNNIGFADIVSSCVSPVSKPKACYPNYEDRVELYNSIGNIFDDLVSTYKSVLKPGKRVYVVGYPLVVANWDCGTNVHLEPSEILMANDLTNYLNATIQSAAAAAGVRYVDVGESLVGHRLCEASPSNIAVNGVTAGDSSGIGPIKFLGAESYHPNALGHELMAQAIRIKTSNLTQPMPLANPATPPPIPPGNLHGLPTTGRAPSILKFDGELAQNVVERGQSFGVQSTTPLKPSSGYKVTIDGVQAGVGTSNTQGMVSTTATVPTTAETGFQQLQLTGQNILGQPVAITKTVYVSNGSDDVDGDGVLNGVDKCKSIPNSGQDFDRDGIDDACDPLIGLPPPLKLTNLRSSATLSENTITIVRP